MSAVLSIIYNHNYEKNIDVLDEYYGQRFSRVFHLMPFYSGARERVLPVSANSYEFQNFVYDAYQRLIAEDADQYVFTGDDCIINPTIDERGITERLGITGCYITSAIGVPELDGAWRWVSTIKEFPRNAGSEITALMPSPDDALRRLAAHGIAFPRMNYFHFHQFMNRALNYLKRKCPVLSALRVPAIRRPLRYPLVMSYADFFIVNRASMKEFALYCALTASQRLFVEIALPTSLLLASVDVKYERDIPFVGNAHWGARDVSGMKDRLGEKLTSDQFERYKAFHARTMEQNLQHYGASISELFADQDLSLFVHPLKLSKWHI